MIKSKIKYEAARSNDTHGFWVQELETEKVLVRYYALKDAPGNKYNIYRLPSGELGWSFPTVLRVTEGKNLDKELIEELRSSPYYSPDENTKLISDLQERINPLKK